MDKPAGANSTPQDKPIELIEAMQWVFKPRISLESADGIDASFFQGRELLQYIIDSIQDGVSVLDTDLTVRYVNALMRHWYAGSGSMIGEKCYRAYHDRRVPCENCPILKAIESRSPFLGIVKYSLSGDHKGWQELFAIPILDRDDNVLGVIEYVRDITFQLKINNEMKELLQRFERLEKENEAFSYLLSQRKSEIEQLEETIVNNMERFVRPSLDILKRGLPSNDVEMIEGLINEIVYPITKPRSPKGGQLTARELHVATLIREGKTSKEIAEVLVITLKTVEYHRANIRKKLGLNSDPDCKPNLNTFLMTHM
jgi:DNA-binding CsgD family transcriptional regulator